MLAPSDLACSHLPSSCNVYQFLRRKKLSVTMAAGSGNSLPLRVLYHETQISAADKCSLRPTAWDRQMKPTVMGGRLSEQEGL